MNEQFEINVQRAKSEWQAKQNSCGLLVMAMLVASALGFLNFLWAPGQGSAMLLGLMVVGLLGACVRMVLCAAKVVEARHILEPARIRADVIDVEIVNTPRHHHSRQIAQYSGTRY